MFDLRSVVIDLPIYKCRPYENNLFSIEIEDYEEMLHSIGNVGIIIPVIAREVSDSFYEIVVGRVKFNAAKELGIGTIPAIIRNITDDEARIITVETNLIHRKIDNLKHSELASIIYEYHSSLKSQGRRTDLLNEVRGILNSLEESTLTFSPVVQKLNSAEESGRKFKMSARNVSRYVRLYHLNNGIKNMVDEGLVSIRAGVELSYLSDENQNNLLLELDKTKVGITYEEATQLREHECRGTLDTNIIRYILTGKRGYTHSKSGFRCMTKIYNKYSLYTYTQDEVESIVDKALNLYFSNQSNKDNRVKWGSI